MAEFASKGVAGTALGTGIAGLSLGVLNSLGGLGGMLLGNRVIPFAAGMAAEAGCSENHTVNRYELSMVQENAKLRSDIALRKASGSYMVPVLGDGNRYGLRGCFLCSAISRSTAC